MYSQPLAMHFCQWWMRDHMCSYKFLWPIRRFLFHVAVATVEMHHPQPHWAHMQCWVPISIQQASTNVNRCNFFIMDDFSLTPLLHTNLRVICCFARLPSTAICHTAKMSQNLCGKVKSLLPYQYSPLTTWVNKIKYEALPLEQLLHFRYDQLEHFWWHSLRLCSFLHMLYQFLIFF